MSNELRESANNFWVTVNSLGISSIAYIRDASNVESNQKPLIIWVLVLLGLTLCFSWLGYLRAIKKSIDQKYALIIVMEKYLPVQVFQVLLQKTERDENKNSLTIREIFVPIAFLLGYIFFGILLIFFNK